MEILKLLEIIVVVTALLSLEALSWGKTSGGYSGCCVDNILAEWNLDRSGAKIQLQFLC